MKALVRCSIICFLIGSVGSVHAAAGDVCYANGRSYGEGAQLCMGGTMMVCTNGGWAVLGSGHRCLREDPPSR